MGCASSKTSTVDTSNQKEKLEGFYGKGAQLSQNLVQQLITVNPLEKYEVVKKLGAGSMGSVSLVRPKAKKDGEETTKGEHGSSSQFLAMKTIRPGRISREFLAELHTEIQAVRMLDHPHIIRFHEVYHGGGKTKGQISIIMDYCAGGDLYHRAPYSEVQAAAILLQVLQAVSYMHARQLVHRDIKFENIMFTSKTNDAPVKIIDFGFAARYDPARGPLRKQLGTFDTMSPEVFSGNYTSQTDLWSVGCVAYELLSGVKPFAAMTPMGVIGKIAKGHYELEGSKHWEDKSRKAKSFVKSLLERDPNKRLTAKQALEHDWMKSMAKHHSIDHKPIDTASSHGLQNQVQMYARDPKIKKIALLMIAHKSFPEEVIKLREQFQVYDTEGTGSISLDEFRSAYRKVHETYPGDEEMKRMFDAMDVYDNQEVAYTEFLAALLEMHVNLTEERIADAFERLDITQSGFISMEDLRLLLGEDFSQHLAEGIISQVDTENDGKISYAEFLALFHKNETTLGKEMKVLVDRGTSATKRVSE